MRRTFLLPLFALGFAGLAHAAPAPSMGYLPADAFGSSVIQQDPASAATLTAMDAFSYPGTLQGQPAKMALGIASLDAMAGQFWSEGRWVRMNMHAKQEMLDARSQVRGILGVPQDVPSQSVIDHLVDASHALDRGDQSAALAALSGPDFTMTPAQTLAVLTNFPNVPAANYATLDASHAFYPSVGNGFGPDGEGSGS